MTLAHSFGRLADHLPLGVRPAAAARPGTGPGLLAQGRRLIHDLVALLREREPRGAGEAGASDLPLAEAQRASAQWHTRWQDAEARARTLEARLADAELVALDLRARLVCLQGKLAATSATARYQSLTQALDGALPTSPSAGTEPRP